jgi:hypothetical protein
MSRRSSRPARIVAVVLALSLVPAAVAAKNTGGGRHGGGGATGSSTIGLVLLNSTDGLAHYDQSVTFNVSTTATTQPWVHLRCTQNGAMVAEGWAGYFDGSLSGRDFTLASPSWTGGAADCTAYLTKPDGSVLASTSFHVGA